MSQEMSQEKEPCFYELDWYHPNSDRHIAESLLMQNGQDGCYLLRPSSRAGELALSVRCKDSVKHYNVTFNGHDFKFGMATFSSMQEFARHFENQPLLAGESGVLTLLKYPYPRSVKEPELYDQIRIHASYGKNQSLRHPPQLAIASKEGFLTKQGWRVKNWKQRWFVLKKNELRYYRERNDTDPVRSLDLAECSECCRDTVPDMDNCFKLVFPWRTFYLHANSDREIDEWMDLIKWKLVKLKEEATAVVSPTTATTKST